MLVLLIATLAALLCCWALGRVSYRAGLRRGHDRGMRDCVELLRPFEVRD